MNYHIITVATHNFGTLQEIINNKFNQHVEVLGFGKKWTGFNMKFELVIDHLEKNTDDDDIVIFIDGFDSLIVQEPTIALQIFQEKGYKTLFSKNSEFNNKYFQTIVNKVFVPEEGRFDSILNSGLYMGYSKYIKEILKDNLSLTCKDDQVCLNQIANYSKYNDIINVDYDEEIFQNINPDNGDYNNKAVFISYPGSVSVERYTRALKEYGQFFIKELLIIWLVLNFTIVIFIDGNNRILPLSLLNVFFILYFLWIDTSCI